MGTLITQHVKRNQNNPFAGLVSRGADGALMLDLASASGVLRGTDGAGADSVGARDMRQALGDSASVDSLRSYRREYQGTTGGDADMAVTNVFSPFSGDIGQQALDSALEAFEIQERGQADAARIAQSGRDKAAIANMGSGIASAQRRALGAAEQNAYDAAGGQEGGVADVIEGSNVEDAGGEEGGGETTRRRRQSYGGAGLAMRI